MDLKVLEEIGLSPNEAKIYETLLETGRTTINNLSVESNVHRRNVYDSIEKLVKKGLANEEFVSGTKYVKAINPTRLLDIVREKEAKVNSILPELQDVFNKKIENEEALIYRGIEGVKNYLNDILETNEPAYFIGAKAFWLDERLKYYLPKFEKQRVKQGIPLKHIYDYEVKVMKPEILRLPMNEYKFFPKEHSSPMSIDFFGDHVFLFYGVKPGELPLMPVQFTIISSKIAKGVKNHFDFMWKNLGRSVKVGKDSKLIE